MVLLAAAVPLGGGAQAQAADPFLAGQRWSTGPPPGAPWIPRDVALAARDELVWSAPSVANPSLLLFASGSLGPGAAPLFPGPDLAGAIGGVQVEAGPGMDELYALAQFPAPGGLRETRLWRYDAAAPGGPGTLLPTWEQRLPPDVAGPARLALGRDGGGPVVASLDPTAGVVQVTWHDPLTGAAGIPQVFSAPGLSACAVSADGSRVALTAGLRLVVLDAQAGVLHDEVLPAATTCLALSGDGRSLVVGGFQQARLLVEDPTGLFVAGPVWWGAPSEMSIRAALDHDGATLALGWWETTSGTATRVETYDLPSGALLHQVIQSLSPSGLQNQPSALAVTPDGRRIAIGFWGAGGSEPEVVLLERGRSAPIQAWDLGGSVEALDLAADGTRIAVAAKDAHANQFATTGRVLLLDTGERDLQTLAEARVGGTLRVASSLPGQTSALFALGSATTPSVVPGLQGLLGLDPAAPLWVYGADPDVSGRADLSVAIPADSAFAGLAFGVQGAGWVGAQVVLTAVRAEPAVL